MKLIDLFEEKEKTGTYAGVRFDADTKQRIKTFIKDNKIPNPIPTDKIHTTLLYSRKRLPEYEAAGKLDPPLVGKPLKFDVWLSQPDDDGEKTKCLVLQYECTDLIKRHKKLMKEHGGTFDFDEYKPHVTFSYDIGDFDIKLLDPKKIGDLKLVTEYQEDLNFDWARSNKSENKK